MSPLCLRLLFLPISSPSVLLCLSWIDFRMRLLYFGLRIYLCSSYFHPYILGFLRVSHTALPPASFASVPSVSPDTNPLYFAPCSSCFPHVRLLSLSRLALTLRLAISSRGAHPNLSPRTFCLLQLVYSQCSNGCLSLLSRYDSYG